MRKELRPVVVLSEFCEALTIVGYGKLRPEEDPCTEWRHGSFHLFLRTKGRGGLVTVSFRIHKDIPKSFPPFHRSKRRGKDLEAEIGLIQEAYQRIRRGGI